MGGGNRGLPMEQRVRLSRASSGRDVEGSGAAPQDGPARHCWVSGAVDDDGVKRPGLLVEWRETGRGWEGRVVYVARLRPDGWVVVEEWLPAELLAPR